MSRGTGALLRQPSGLRDEVQAFLNLVRRYAAHQLGQFFSLSSQAGAPRRIRAAFLILLFAVAALCLQMLLQVQLGPGNGSQLQLTDLAAPALLAALRIVLIMGIAASMALSAAGYFLADVFELKDARTAWKFIANAASASHDEVIHLREGRVVEADRNSLIALVGGPGRAVVEYDTAALFERPDGRPHVVGHAIDGADPVSGFGAGVVLDVFERLREPVIGLRDQYIGNPSGEPLTVIGRSLDGMPISVADVRGVFSVRREMSSTAAETPEQRPYPFRPQDIEDLIYNQAVPVLASGEHASGLLPDWKSVMQGLIVDSLSDFTSQNRLSEFLSGTGVQELEQSEYRADSILSRTLQVSSEAPGAAPAGAVSSTKFHPRTELSARFKKYGSEFSTKAKEYGLELHWIGVGTWKMPDESSGAAVSEKHLEAWRMNRENAQRSEPKALQQVAGASALERKLRLIQEIPIASHQNNQTRYSDKSVLLECLLQDFWEQLGEALEVAYRTGTPTPEVDDLEQAVLKVEQLLQISQLGHVLGGGTMSRVRPRSTWALNETTPPAPATRGEAAKYQALLSKLEGNYKVAEAMIANEARRHASLGREQLIARIVERFERHGR